jgi:hypothetical protein
MIRKVKYNLYDFRIGTKPIVTGEAIFHQFGTDFEEFENGAVNYSTAIIELPDGTIRNIPVQHIQFINPITKVNIV